MKKILVVDDNQQMLLSLVDCLKKEDRKIMISNNLQRAEEIICQEKLDLIIFDRLFPEADSYELIKSIRSHDKRIMIFVLSRLSKIEEKTKCLKYVDDYLIKPFSYFELRLRVENLLNKRHLLAREKFQLNSLLNYSQALLSFRQAEFNQVEKVFLCKKESEIFNCLLEYQNMVVSYQQIKDHVWGYSQHRPNNKTISVYIRRIRSKLGNSAIQLKTVKGLGYCLERAKMGKKH